MKLSKRQLKRIIREEYNRLKRRDLIMEAFELRPGQSLADAAEEMVAMMDIEEPGSVKQAHAALNPRNPFGRRPKMPDAWDKALEALDQDAPGEGGWPEHEAIDALARAIKNRLYGKYGRYNPR